MVRGMVETRMDEEEGVGSGEKMMCRNAEESKKTRTETGKG